MGVSPITLINSCHPDVSGNDFGGASETPVVTGDCTAPGLPPVTSSTKGTAADRARRTCRRPGPPARRREAALPDPWVDGVTDGRRPPRQWVVTGDDRARVRARCVGRRRRGRVDPVAAEPRWLRCSCAREG